MNLYELTKKLQGYQPTLLVDKKKQSSVAVIISETEQACEILLTKRNSKLASYAGDWCLVGGKIDKGESPISALIREVEEEIGITLHESDIKGRLNDFYTVTGAIVKIFVVQTKYSQLSELRINRSEIEDVVYLPLERLGDFSVGRDVDYISKRKPGYYYKIKLNDKEIYVWGLTASVLVHLYNVLEQRQFKVGYQV